MLEVLKFLLGAAILVLALLDVDPQPVIVIIALVLMGVITVDQVQGWLSRRRNGGTNGHV